MKSLQFIYQRVTTNLCSSRHPHSSFSVTMFAVLASILFSMHFSPASSQTVVDVKNRLQVNEGWGVSLCWWANMVGKWQNEEKLDSIVDFLCSPEHLNYNIFRYNIGGGDDPQWRNCEPHHFGKPRSGKGLRAEMPGFKDSLDDDYHWDRDEAQRRVMLKIRERRPDAIFEAFSNSAPYYLTVSGCVGGAKRATDDNVPPKYYDEFAHYLVDVCRHYKERYGLEFRTLDPFNEPETNYWSANGSQEGCHFSPASQIRFLHVLAPILAKSGLNTRISASDETSVAQSIEDFRTYQKDGEALECVFQWNTHTYKADNAQRNELRQLVRQAGKHFWMSETGDGGRGIHGNLMMAQRLIDDIRYLQPDAWVDWQYIEEYGDQWSLIRSDWNNEQYVKVKNYYVRYNFTHYIRQGYIYLATDNPHLLCAISPDGSELVFVCINTEARDKRAETIDVSSFSKSPSITSVLTTRREDLVNNIDFKHASGVVSFEMPPLSIATYIIKR